MGEIEHWDEFERHLDGLLARLDPVWTMPELPGEIDGPHRQYERLNVKRSTVAAMLISPPDRAVALAGPVLDAIVRDDDPTLNRQLIGPMLHAIGRREVKRRLITAVETGPAHQKLCAARAWYWTEGYGLRESRANPLTPAERQAADDKVADLRAEFRIACLAAFVMSADDDTRDALAARFLLVDRYYPPTVHDLVAQARAIAEAEPERYARLLARSEDSHG